MTNKKNEQEVPMTPELAEMIAKMDAAYQKAAKGFPDLSKDWAFVSLGLRSQVIEQVEEAMAAQGLTRADLARLMGVSRAHVSKILNETGNFQLETIAKLSVALDRDIALRLIRKTEKVVVESVRLPENAAERFAALRQESRRAEDLPSYSLYEPTASLEPKTAKVIPVLAEAA